MPPSSFNVSFTWKRKHNITTIRGDYQFTSSSASPPPPPPLKLIIPILIEINGDYYYVHDTQSYTTRTRKTEDGGRRGPANAPPEGGGWGRATSMPSFPQVCTRYSCLKGGEEAINPLSVTKRGEGGRKRSFNGFCNVRFNLFPFL